MDEPLRKEGATQASFKLRKEALQTIKLDFGKAKKLQELSIDYALFTPALMYLFVNLRGKEPLVAFSEEYNKDLAPFTMQFEKPLFKGVQRGKATAWNHTLMAMRRSDWDLYLPWVQSAAFVDRATQLFVRIRPMLISILDPLYLANAITLVPDMPRVDVTVLALDTNRGNILISDEPLSQTPRMLVTKNVFDDTASIASELFADQERLYAKINASEDSLQKRLTEETGGYWEPPVPERTVDIGELPRSEQLEIFDLAKFFANSNRRG